MIRRITASVNTELDQVLELLCESLQLTPSERKDAENKYNAVGNWLSAPESELRLLRPDIKYQGSILLGTVVRPWQREEFDVDLLCILTTNQVKNPDPMLIYERVAMRLAQHAVYKRLMNRKDRCIELDYAGQFHLDIVPAIPVVPGGDSLLIPDRQGRSWVYTDPFGYARWFYGRTPVTKVAAKYELREEIAPLPPPSRAADIAPLQRTIQLLKRRRDLYFNGSDDAPKSIALTTLAAKHYGGEPLCTDALVAVLSGINGEISRTAGILKVPNPVDPSEDLGRHWNDRSYRRFTRFVNQFIEEMTSLIETHGWDHICELLEEMFGDRARGAVEKYASRMESGRRHNRLGYVAGPVLLTPTATQPRHVVPRNEFYGT